MGRRWVPRPRPRRRNNNNRRRSRKNNNNNIRRAQNEHMTSIKILTQPTKGSHNKEEIYPVLLSDLISRRNVGTDADINIVGYTLSIALATGNDVSTVTANIGHSGPWVRRGNSTDKFDQQFPEHTFRGKSILFRKRVVRDSEREYVNPDTDDNMINIRIRDPCGVIPGVMMKIEARFHLIRRIPSTEFAGASEKATDQYEDQDVSTGPQPGPTPPGPVAYNVPKIIKNILGGAVFTYVTKDTASPFHYTLAGSGTSFTVTLTTTPVTAVGEFATDTNGSQMQIDYQNDGFSGQITYN